MEEPQSGEETEFKKPILIGKIGRLPKKIPKDTKKPEVSSEAEETVINDTPDEATDQSGQVLPSCSYVEPTLSCLPLSKGEPYRLEVLKSGTIVEVIDVMSKAYWVFGRSTNCDIPLAHPAISRFHAVLQYRGETTETEQQTKGFFIYDLASTHGTFVNKARIKPHTYVPVRVGHIMKFGLSTRSFLLTGPEEDAEEESQFTLTELKQQRAEKIAQRELAEQEANLKKQQEAEELRKKEEERGVDWGLGEDADEEPDLTENPYAQTNNEQLYIEDPKKALRGFMEREGFTLDYDCSEHGFGQFLCKVELPVDDENGRPIIAEVLHKGKKKEAVVQCALEACRILDRYGMLRQATHESRKRKAKNWEENDYYDSDDDTFLDRTGTIEKKREKRMQTKMSQKPETYQGLLEKEKKIRAEILKIDKQLAADRLKNTVELANSASTEDTLDSYMKELKDTKLTKQEVSQLKSNLIRLKTDLATVVKLANLAKPVDLPELKTDKIAKVEVKKALRMFGKRPKIEVALPEKKPVEVETNQKVVVEPIKKEQTEVIRELSNSEDESSDDDEDELRKKQKRNQRRIRQRRDKAEMQKQKGYAEDARKEDYNMWIPPKNQTGDGRTTLNDKYGY